MQVFYRSACGLVYRHIQQYLSYIFGGPIIRFYSNSTVSVNQFMQLKKIKFFSRCEDK